ncbi:MAG: hypothetical protein ABEH38_07065 [Flavobacteriales bacterium]
MRSFLYPFCLTCILAMGISACCLNCKETVPETGTLNVQLSDGVTDSIFLRVFQSRTPQDCALVVRDTLSKSRSYTLESDFVYSGKATYKKNGKKVIALDRGEIEVKDKSDRNCADSVCYIPDEGELDLVLKEKPF